jgi:hypothetical protein
MGVFTCHLVELHGLVLRACHTRSFLRLQPEVRFLKANICLVAVYRFRIQTGFWLAVEQQEGNSPAGCRRLISIEKAPYVDALPTHNFTLRPRRLD